MNLPAWKKIVMPVIAAILATTICYVAVSSIDQRAMAAEKKYSMAAYGIKNLDIVRPPVKKVVVIQSAIQEKEETSEVVEVVLEDEAKEPIIVEETSIRNDVAPVEEIPTLDRTKPLYNVYKGGIRVEVNTDLQWYIRDMCENYSFYEKYVYGMILTESTFQPTVSNGGCIGLCQINSFWINDARMVHFTDDYKSRDLKDPYDNLLTMTEMWCYARDTYGLDLMTDDGMMRVLYWHNTGDDPRRITSSSYYNTCLKYANELVPLQ